MFKWRHVGAVCCVLGAAQIHLNRRFEHNKIKRLAPVVTTFL